MESARKFYRQVFTYEILSEEPIGQLSLEDVAYETSEGHMSGHFTNRIETEHSAKEMAKMMEVQGSDPEFFQLTETGEDTE